MASRTVSFVSKVKAIPLANVAAKIMVGKKIKCLWLPTEKNINYVAVKETVFFIP